MALVFFDLDRTVLSVNSGRLWVDHEVKHGFLTRWQALRAIWWIGTYHVGFTRMESLLEEAIETLGGTRELDLVGRTEAFYAAQIDRTYRPGALAAVERHREAGDTISLLTTASVYLCAPVLRRLDIEHALCNRFEVAEGRFTGRPSGPLCYGVGKVEHARALCDRVGSELTAATFYTDSMSDLPMLEAVGHPVAVNPDPRLRRVAVKRSWPILDWGR